MTTDAKIKSNATSPSAIHGPVRDLESSLPEILAALQVPGLTVSVFKDGEQLLHRGFGTRILGRDDTPVDTDTLFDLCSITKHITAAAASKLVHDGKLKWNEPVTKYMPTWQFSDPVLTKSVTMVDLLSHRTGLAGHNEMQMGNRNGNLSAGHRDPADFLPHLAMGDQFRSSGIYSNLSFALATRVIEEVSGQAYPDFVAEHLFDPLGIKDYEWCYHAFAKHPNAALPHYVQKHVYGSEKSLEDRIAELEMVESPESGLAMCKANPIELETYSGYPEDLRDAVGAGVFYVSANAMVKWAQCLINEGKAPDGQRQIVHGLDMIFKVHNPTSYTTESKATPSFMRSLGYGLGMGIWQFGEYNVLSHDGGMPGVLTQLVLVPRAKTFIYLASKPFGSPLRVRFVKDEAVKDPRPLPKRKAGFAWRERVKYRMVLTEGTAQLDIVFERVDF